MSDPAALDRLVRLAMRAPTVKHVDACVAFLIHVLADRRAPKAQPQPRRRRA